MSAQKSSVYDAVIVLGGGITPAGELSATSQSRLDYGLSLYEREEAPLVLSGKWSLLFDTPPPQTEAHAMRQYAISKGVAAIEIYLEEESMDTIGNAYFTKTKVMDPRHWHRALCVTSEFHVPRAMQTFQKVFGPGYTLDFVAAPSGLNGAALTAKKQTEAAIAAFTDELLQTVPPGDDNATWSALQHLPGYGTQPTCTREDLRRILQAQPSASDTYGLSGN